MRIVRRVGTQILAFQAIAVRILVGVFVEVRHLGGRPPAGDDLDQLGAIERSLVQVGSSTRRARIAAPVAVRAVAELAIGLFVEEAVAEGYILGGGWAELDGA